VTAAAAIVVAIVLVAVGALLVAVQRSGLTNQLDDTLSAEADRLAEYYESNERLPTGINDDLLVVVLDGSGAVIDDEGDDEELAQFRAVVAAGHRSDGNATVDGEPVRIAAESFDETQGSGRVLVAGSREEVENSVSDLRTSLLWVIPLAVLAIIGVVWVLVGRTLRPVEQIRAQVASIGMRQLDRRVPVPPSGDEIARLAATMNEMLARLETSVRRQQQFVADASHELRTPLTRMRTELEVDERDPQRSDPAATRRSQLDEIAGLQRMIEDLLLLARSDAGTTAIETELVDLDDLVLDEVDAAQIGPARNAASPTVRIDASGVSAAQVTGSPQELRRVVRNLLDNARRHARGVVAVALDERAGEARLVIGDDGPGIPPEDRARVFERFTRLDESRTGAGHAGLGLAIVQEIVSRHRGRVTIDDGPLGGARVTVVLPAASAVDSAARPPAAEAPARSLAWPPPSPAS
jgi:signal transduction histidine kinase